MQTKNKLCIKKQSKYFFLILFLLLYTTLLTRAQVPTSSSFKIKGDALTSGSINGESTSFDVSGENNPLTDYSQSTNFTQKIGYNPRIQANTPYAPALSNPTNSAHKLTIVIDTSSNPDDTLFAVSLKTGSVTKYVQNDGTLGNILGIEDYRTFANWGGGGGDEIIGLIPSTTYTARARALNENFTETRFGPESNAETTSVLSLTLTSSDSSLGFGTLSAQTISSTQLTLTVSTTNDTGYTLSARGTGSGALSGLYNTLGAALINSSNTTLTPGTEGYGMQASSVTATIAAQYNVSGAVVGEVELTDETLASNIATVTNEDTDVLFKAAITGTTEAGVYQDTLIFTVTTNP